MSAVGQNRKSSTRAYVFRFAPKSRHYATHAACPFGAQKQTCHTSIPRLLTEAEFTMRYMMLIHHDEVALAKAPPSLWGDYAARKVN
jgi:hypothetical protein